jgi:hypothetical protein
MHLEDGMSVQRYGWGHSGMLTTPSNSGNYVAHADYEQLERTAKMLAEALIRVIENKWEPDKYHMATHDALAAARKDGLL